MCPVNNHGSNSHCQRGTEAASRPQTRCDRRPQEQHACSSRGVALLRGAARRRRSRHYHLNGRCSALHRSRKPGALLRHLRPGNSVVPLRMRAVWRPAGRPVGPGPEPPPPPALVRAVAAASCVARRATALLGRPARGVDGSVNLVHSYHLLREPRSKQSKYPARQLTDKHTNELAAPSEFLTTEHRLGALCRLPTPNLEQNQS